jgi:hypothetical protein
MADFLSNLSPEEVDQYLKLYGMNQQAQTLKEQRQEAAQGRNRPRQQFRTWGGALAGGLGDALGTVASKVRENELTEEEKKLQGQATDTRAKLLQAYLRARGGGEEGLPGPAPAMAMGAEPSAPMNPMPKPPMDSATASALGVAPPQPDMGPMASGYGAPEQPWSPTMNQPPAMGVVGPGPRPAVARAPPAGPRLERLSSATALDRLTDDMSTPQFRAKLSSTPEGMNTAALFDAWNGYRIAGKDTSKARQDLLRALATRGR